MMKTSGPFAALLAFLLTGSALQAQSAPETAVSSAGETAAAPISVAPAAHAGVRIVRLSQVKGEAQLDRHTDRGFEAAFPNLPIVQGSRLKTGEGVAEVEFEDASSMRLTPDTLVEFPKLTRDEAGNTVSTVNVVSGTVYLSMASSKTNQLYVTSPEARLIVAPASHLHYHVGSPKTALSVMDGSVQAEVGGSVMVVGKKKTLFLDPANHQAPTLVSSVQKTPYDDWDKQQVDYQKRYMVANSFGSAGPAYGLADMNYYGGFGSVGGCGQMWRPYLASANWSPFANGVWAYYPSAGYSWVSPYPWGWTAMHSGSWQFCEGAGGGWGWTPGNTFYGLDNSASLVRVSKGATRLRPPARPAPGKGTLYVVSTQPLAVSRMKDSSTFEFRQDSAGLGVPRQTFGKLSHVSQGVSRHGSVSVAAFPVGVSSASSSLGQSSQIGLATVRAGSSMSSLQSSRGSSGGFSGAPSAAGVGASRGGGMSSGAMGTAGSAAGGSHR